MENPGLKTLITFPGQIQRNARAGRQLLRIFEEQNRERTAPDH